MTECITINENYRIKRDKLNWILEERYFTNPNNKRSKSTEPEERWKETFHNSIKSLILEALDKSLGRANVMTLEQLQIALESAEKDLIQAIERLDKSGMFKTIAG